MRTGLGELGMSLVMERQITHGSHIVTNTAVPLTLCSSNRSEVIYSTISDVMYQISFAEDICAYFCRFFHKVRLIPLSLYIL